MTDSEELADDNEDSRISKMPNSMFQFYAKAIGVDAVEKIIADAMDDGFKSEKITRILCGAFVDCGDAEKYDAYGVNKQATRENYISAYHERFKPYADALIAAGVV